MLVLRCVKTDSCVPFCAVRMKPLMALQRRCKASAKTMKKTGAAHFGGTIRSLVHLIGFDHLVGITVYNEDSGVDKRGMIPYSILVEQILTRAWASQSSVLDIRVPQKVAFQQCVSIQMLLSIQFILQSIRPVQNFWSFILKWEADLIWLALVHHFSIQQILT